MFSLNEEFITKIINGTLPSFQNINLKTQNLGFGLIYYSFIRVLRPENTVVVGSKAGFSPIMIATAVKDNEGVGVGKIECYKTSNIDNEKLGKVFFVDPSYSINRGDNNHWCGIGHWDNEDKVNSFWKEYNVEDIVEHYKMTSKSFVEEDYCPNDIDLVYIDGDHSYEGIQLDIQLFYPKLKRNGIIILHDVDPMLPMLDPNTGGFELFSNLSTDMFEKIRIPVFPGLAILRKK